MNWRQRISVARERGYFTLEDNKLIVNWDTCLVGEALGSINKRMHDPDIPFDQYLTLQHLGSMGKEGEMGPCWMVYTNEFDALEMRQLIIEETVREFFPESKLASESELVAV